MEEGGRERGVFRRQLPFRRKRLPLVLAKEGSRTRVKPVHIGTQWESPRENRKGQIPLCVSFPEGLTLVKQQTGAKKTGQWEIEVIVKQVLPSCPEMRTSPCSTSASFARASPRLGFV